MHPHTQIGLWSGHIQLKDVAVRPDALYSLGLPLSVKAGRVETLQIDIPWRRIGKEVSAAGARTSSERPSLSRARGAGTSISVDSFGIPVDSGGLA